MGGLIYGYDLAGIAGAILFIKKEFSLSPFSQELVLSSVLFGTMIGAALGGRLTDRLGRRKILIISAVISISQFKIKPTIYPSLLSYQNLFL